VVDHDALRDFIKAQNEGVPAKEPQVNAGTRLVVDVMNGIKRLYPFVDLLKPETVPVPGVLLALPTHLHAPLLDFAKITLRLAFDSARKETGFLGADAPAAPPADGYRALDMLVRGLRDQGGRADDGGDAEARAAAWLDQAETDFAAGKRPVDVVGEDGYLGIGSIILDRLVGRDPREDLRQALRKYLVGDRTFLFDTEDAVYLEHDREVGPDVHFIIAGHTHLERRIPRTRGAGVYFNSGTWIRLIQIHEESLSTPDAFEPLYQALSSGRLADLDAAPGLVVQRRTVVSIWSEGGEVHGELRHALPAEEAAAAPAPWKAVTGTRFTSTSVEKA
jgi:hypothetical protein